MRQRMMVALGIGVLLAASVARAGERAPLSVEEIEKAHRMIKRQPGESRWMEIDWHPNVWEARQKAAREGKPLFLWAGSGGAPAAGC
jgi:hypothetical protein